MVIFPIQFIKYPSMSTNELKLSENELFLLRLRVLIIILHNQCKHLYASNKTNFFLPIYQVNLEDCSLFIITDMWLFAAAEKHHNLIHHSFLNQMLD